MKQIVDQLNKIAKKIDENVDIPNTDLITDSLDAITTALGGTPNDSNLIVDKLEDIAGVATGGGGSATITRTYTLLPAGTYTAQDMGGGEYSIRHYYDYQEPLSLCTPDQDIVVTINNVPYTFSTASASHGSTYLYEYERIDGGNTYYLQFSTSGFRLDVPSAGDYDVEAVTITTTGKPITVKPVDQDLNSFGINIAAKVGETDVCYSIAFEEGEIEIPVDLLIEARLDIYD